MVALLLAVALAPAAAPADTCWFDLPGVIRQSPDAPIRALPLLERAAVDSLGLYAGWTFLGPGAAGPEHEDDRDEMLGVVCGSARFRVGDREAGLAQGAALRVPLATRHAALAGSKGMVAVQGYRPGNAGLRFYGWDEARVPPG